MCGDAAERERDGLPFERLSESTTRLINGNGHNGPLWILSAAAGPLPTGPPGGKGMHAV